MCVCVQNKVPNVEICLDALNQNSAFKASVLAGNSTIIVVNQNSGNSTGKVAIIVVSVVVALIVVLLLFVCAYLYLARNRSSAPGFFNKGHEYEVCFDPLSLDIILCVHTSTCLANAPAHPASVTHGTSMRCVLIHIIHRHYIVFAYLYLARRRSSPPSFFKKGHKYEVCVGT